MRSEREMRSMALDRWDDTHPPFEPFLQHRKENDRFAAHLEVRPDAVSKLRLADYARSRGYDRHELHGTLGKTCDVLLVASGVIEAGEARTQPVDSGKKFITFKSLQAYFRKARLHHDHVNDIHNELTCAIRSTMQNAQPPEYGEVIFEGFVNLHSARRFERVAVKSLLAMAQWFPEGRPIRRALEGLGN